VTGSAALDAGAQRVLVVDDDVACRQQVCDALAGDGVDCEPASTGDEARKASDDPRLACVVLGVGLREPPPLELLAVLTARSPAVQVIALAGASDQERVLEALRRGACDYLAKPVHAEELRLAVRRALAHHALERRLVGLEVQLAEERAARESEARAAREAAAAPAPDAGGEDPHLELLREICDAMTREIEPDRLWSAALRPVARATSARVASVLLIDNQRGRLVCEAQCAGADTERDDLPRNAGLTGASLQSGAIVAAERPERDPRFDPDVDTPESGATGPMLVLPLRVRGRTLGVARIFTPAEVGAPARLAELVAAPLSAATRNVLLYRSLLDSVEDVARARREAESRRG
jgi:FixJ family two-component response regulator